MSWTKFLLWAVVILLVAYAFNINIPAVVGGLFHGLQQMHNQQAGHG
jgi:hypothetical protein